jgi:short-subunit dehydrogenase
MSGVAVVTGASSGLGFEIAALLKASGSQVIGVSRRGPDVKGDASKRATALRALDPRVNLLVNCAGVGIYHAAGSYSDEEIAETINANLISMITFCDVFLETIQKNNGTIVNVMSTAALVGKPNETVYCAAKWGARGYTEALRAEAKGTRIVAVYPGGMNTAFWRGDPKAAKFMDPNDVAATILDSISRPGQVVTDVVINRP